MRGDETTGRENVARCQIPRHLPQGSIQAGGRCRSGQCVQRTVTCVKQGAVAEGWQGKWRPTVNCSQCAWHAAGSSAGVGSLVGHGKVRVRFHVTRATHASGDLVVKEINVSNVERNDRGLGAIMVAGGRWEKSTSIVQVAADCGNHCMQPSGQRHSAQKQGIPGGALRSGGGKRRWSKY